MTEVLSPPDADAAAREHAAWRAARERELRTPHGWLSPAALTRPASGDTATLVGERVEPDGPTSVVVGEGRSRILGTFLPQGRAAGAEREVAVEVVLRTGRYGVRPRDPEAATRTGFDGVPAFDHDPAWVLDVPVRWYDEPEAVTVGAAQPRLVHHVEVFGEVDVAHAGTVTTLALTGSSTEPTLLFTDESDEVAPWRVLRVPVPVLVPGPPADDADRPAPGTLRLDLNRAVNLPYAFTPFGTCPAPLAGNHLPFALTAGEKAPR